jgi:hypothetical protein
MPSVFDPRQQHVPLPTTMDPTVAPSLSLESLPSLHSASTSTVPPVALAVPDVSRLFQFPKPEQTSKDVTPTMIDPGVEAELEYENTVSSMSITLTSDSFFNSFRLIVHFGGTNGALLQVCCLNIATHASTHQRFQFFHFMVF